MDRESIIREIGRLVKDGLLEELCFTHGSTEVYVSDFYFDGYGQLRCSCETDEDWDGDFCLNYFDDDFLITFYRAACRQLKLIDTNLF